jgi:hypothetical protein
MDKLSALRAGGQDARAPLLDRSPFEFAFCFEIRNLEPAFPKTI